MTQMHADSPRVQGGGLVTVAFLKARLDEGSDHLGIFMPLIMDAVARVPSQSFATADIQEMVAANHGLVIPQDAVSTLLKRVTRKRYLTREAGRYRRNAAHEQPLGDLAAEKARILEAQLRLGRALQNHAARRGLTIESTEQALELLLRFLEGEQVALLLAGPILPGSSEPASQRERGILAEFVQDVVRNDPALASILREFLEGLVLYHAAFLPDLPGVTRRFNDLRVLFDSVLIRQALGYEGDGARILMRETVALLQACGVQCHVLDKTADEIRRILDM